MSVPLTVLGLLEEHESHGYDLKSEFDARFSTARELNFGQVYRTLAQLVRDGLADIAGVEAGEGPSRKRYVITPAGVAELDRWLSTPEDPRPHLQSTLFTKIALATTSGRDVAHFLDVQREAHLRAMHEVTERRRAAERSERLLADYLLFHLEADLRWLDHVEATRKERK